MIRIARIFNIILCMMLSIATAKIPSIEQWIATAQQSLHKKVLSNGITVLFYPVTHTPIVDMKVYVDVGSRDEKTGQFGLAHMVEHMIFKGTDIMSEVDLKIIAENYGGARWNAFTSMDQTCYYFQTDNKHWPLFLGILADCMQNVRFDENHFASEVKTVINELNKDRSNPMRKMIEHILFTQFPHTHPYHHSPIGNREDLVASSATDLKNFYMDHYTPDKTVITVVGNIDSATLFDTVEALFGSIPIKPSITRSPFNRNAFIPTDFIEHNAIMHTQTTNPVEFIHWITAGERSHDVQTGHCVSYILKERLKKLKDDYDLIYSHDVFLAPLFDAAIFGVLYEPKDIANNFHIQSIIEEEIDNLSTAGPKDPELNQFKQLTFSALANSFENVEAIASVLGAYCLNKNEYQVIDNFKFVQNISAQDIKNFCHHYLTRNIRGSITCLPLKETEIEAWTSQQKQIESYEKNLLESKERQTPLEEPHLVYSLPAPQELDINFSAPDLETTLSNGLKVYVTQRTQTPHILLQCVFNNTASLYLKYAQQQKTSLPSIAMSLLKEESTGTAEHSENFSKKEHTDFFAAHGAGYALSSSGIAVHCLSYNADTVIQRLFHILTHPTFPEKPFDRQRNNAIDRIIMNQDDAGYAARRSLGQYLYRDCPWTYSDEETINHLKNLSLDDVRTFYQHEVAPENMAIILVGNIEPQEAVTMLENIFGRWKNPHATPSQNLDAITFKNPEAQQFLINKPNERVILFGGRLTTTKVSTDTLPLVIIEQYLNRLLFNIREQTGVFYGCSASLAPSTMLETDHAIICTGVMPENLDFARQAIMAALNEVAINGIPEDYIQAAKMRYTASIATSFSTMASLGESYTSLIQNNLPFSYYHDCSTNIHALNKETIDAVAHLYCDPATWTFIAAGPVNG